MSAITDLLRSTHLTGGVFLDAEFTAPWCVTSQVGPEDCGGVLPTPQSVVAFHYVSAGRLLLQVGDGVPDEVEAGEVVALPRNDPHRLGSEITQAAVSADLLIRPGDDGRLAQIRHGGGGATTRLVCGFLGTDRANDPLLAMLPRVMRLRVDDAAAAEWMASSFRFAAGAGAHGNPELVARLAEVLFMEALTRYFATADGVGSGASGLDPKVARAVGLMQDALERPWTTESLAGAVGMSRSAFAARFSRVVGQAPMRYLARLRLRTAARRLQTSPDALARIASAVGYQSEAAFNRAFKREFGLPPAAWRKRGGQ